MLYIKELMLLTLCNVLLRTRDRCGHYRETVGFNMLNGVAYKRYSLVEMLLT